MSVKFRQMRFRGIWEQKRVRARHCVKQLVVQGFKTHLPGALFAI
jgi:hypothetical protein